MRRVQHLGDLVPAKRQPADAQAVPETVDVLLDCLSSDAWPMPLPADYRESLHEVLLADKANAVETVDAVETPATLAEIATKNEERMVG